MPTRILLTAIAAAATIAAFEYRVSGHEPSQTPAPADGQRTVWDAVYTTEQAKRGEEVYRGQCLPCHGEGLQGGGPATPLTGDTFMSNWNGVSMGDMLERVKTSMPLSAPGTLSRQQVADVLAYVLSYNKFPAGKVELSRQTEMLNQIKFLSQKPGS